MSPLFAVGLCIPSVSCTMVGMAVLRLDEPESLSGIQQRIAEIDMALVNAYEYAGDGGARPYIIQVQRSFMSVVQLFTERMRTNPITPRESRFWSKVKTYGVHMIWTGMGGDEPRFDWTEGGESRRVSAARVAWLLIRAQDVPQGRYLRKQCDTARCISPECHTLASAYEHRPSVRRIRKDVRSDGAGGWIHMPCGQPLRKAPQPGRRPYCPVCYQNEQATLRAVRQAQAASLSSRAYFPPTPPRALLEPSDEPDDASTPTVFTDLPTSPVPSQRLSWMQYMNMSQAERDTVPDEFQPKPTESNLFDEE